MLSGLVCVVRGGCFPCEVAAGTLRASEVAVFEASEAAVLERGVDVAVVAAAACVFAALLLEEVLGSVSGFVVVVEGAAELLAVGCVSLLVSLLSDFGSGFGSCGLASGGGGPEGAEDAGALEGL